MVKKRCLVFGCLLAAISLILFWYIHFENRTKTLFQRDGEVFVDAAFCDKVSQIVVATDSGIVRSIDSNGDMTAEWSEPGSMRVRVAINFDGSLIAACRDLHLVRIWNPQSRQVEMENDFDEEVTAIAFSPTENLLVVGTRSEKGRAYFWNLDTEELKSMDLYAAFQMLDQSRLEKANKFDLGLKTGKPPLDLAWFPIRDAAFSPNSRFAAFATARGEVVVDVQQREFVQCQKLSGRQLRRVTFSDDGTLIASITEGGLLEVADFPSRRMLFESMTAGRVTPSLWLSPTTIFLCSSENNASPAKLQMINIADSKTIAKFMCHDTTVVRMFISNVTHEIKFVCQDGRITTMKSPGSSDDRSR